MNILYEVTFKQYFILGSREISFKIYFDENEFESGFGDDEHDLDPESLAVELAMTKFFKDYTLSEGSKLEVLSVNRID